MFKLGKPDVLSSPRHATAWAQGLLSTALVPGIVGSFLVGAALLKGYDAAHRELEERSFWTERAFVSGLVTYELGLGMLLLSGYYARVARWVGILTFFVFFEFALYQGLLGETTCRCLGRLSLSPWGAAFMDALAVAGLCAWRPERSFGLAQRTKRFWGTIVVYCAVAGVLVHEIRNYAHLGPVRLLRGDSRLATRISVNLKNAEVTQVLEMIHASTDVECSVSRSLQHRQPSLGTISTPKARAWAFLELIAEKQQTPCRWTQAGKGFELVAASAFGVQPWLLVGAFLGCGALLIPFSQPCQEIQAISPEFAGPSKG